MKRAPLFLAVLGVLTVIGSPATACPMCAGDTPVADTFNVWPIVGAFMLVPPILATVVILAIRRENRRPFVPDAGQ